MQIRRTWCAALAAGALLATPAMAAESGKVFAEGRSATVAKVVKKSERYVVSNPDGEERGYVVKKGSGWTVHGKQTSGSHFKFGSVRKKSDKRYEFLQGSKVAGRVDKKDKRWVITIDGEKKGHVTGLPGGPSAGAALLTFVFQLG